MPARMYDSDLAAIINKDYAHFDISSRTGFLDCENTALEIPKELDEYVWERVLENAKGMRLRGEDAASEKTKAWRERVQNMRVISSLSLSVAQSTSLLRRAYVVLCMLGHFYMHGEGNDSEQSSLDIVPASIATPWLLVSEALGMNPVLCYAAEILWACTFPDSISGSTKALSPDDLKVLNTFTGHPSEYAFVLGPARVELEGAVIINEIFASINTYHSSTTLSSAQDAMTSSLRTILSALSKMTAHLKVVMKECDPGHFYFHLRPWIAGTGDGGWTYGTLDGQAVTKKLGGSTAGASALLQVLDSFLGVEFGGKHGEFRREMQGYMPQGHRALVQVLEKMKVGDVMGKALGKQLELLDSENQNPMRALLQESKGAGVESLGFLLRQAYDEVLGAVKVFRDQHFQIVSLFIINQARKAAARERERGGENDLKQNDAEQVALKGTGGSDLAKLLKGMRDGTVRAMINRN